MTVATTEPYVDLSSADAIRLALKWQIIGLLLMICHALLVKQSLLLTPLMLIGVGWLYANAPLAGITTYLQILFYQNWIIGFFTNGMPREPTFVVLQGTNFAVLLIMACIGWTRLALPAWQSLRPILVVVMVAVMVACIYALLGAMKESPLAASTYFRNTTAMVFAVIVGLDVGRIYSYRTVGIVFLVSAALSVALGYVEVSVPDAYYEATNATSFMALKNSNDPKLDMFWSAQDVTDHNTGSLFNVSGSDSTISQLRFQGTLMHPISYAYIIAVTALVAWSVGLGGWLLLVLPLLVLSGVKGANLLVVGSMLLWLVWVLSRSRAVLLITGLIMMVSYVTFGLLFGMENGDYHVIGLLGGINGFLSNPLGHGIGVGGNLSAEATRSFKWQAYQASGAADFALESAVGVMLYQLGVASIAIFSVFGVLLCKAPWRVDRQSLLFIGLATVMVNGIFQEEAYAPAAAGCFTLLCAVIIANGNRPVSKLREAWQSSLVTAHV